MTTTTNLYPTIADKVQLFRANGIDVLVEYINCGGPTQKICFAGDTADAQAAERIASGAGITILRMSLVYDYYGGKAHPPYWLVEFFHEPPPEFICPASGFTDD